MPEKVFIVGLAGPSGSGKSTVAKRVAARLNGHVISMEVYSADANHLPFEERTKRNYDAPDATDVELLVFDWNIAGIKCYEKAGFTFAEQEMPPWEIGGKSWGVKKMEINRSK